MKPKNIYIIAASVVILIALGIWGFTQTKNKPVPTDNQNQAQQETQTNNNPVSGNNIGILKLSDNPAKGNLMLVGAQNVDKLYIKTSRDFSSLLGKKVQVIFKNGTSENFSLDNIVPAQ